MSVSLVSVNYKSLHLDAFHRVSSRLVGLSACHSRAGGCSMFFFVVVVQKDFE